MSRKIAYQHIDSVEWNQILPRIIRIHNLLGQEVTDEKRVRSKRVVGEMPVIRQMYVGGVTTEVNKSDKSSSANSSMKGSKNKPKLPYL